MKKYIYFFISISLFILLLFVNSELPPFGSGENTSYLNNYVVKKYVDDVLDDTGVLSSIAAILYDYRGFDTLGEATVLYTSVLAVAAMLKNEKKCYFRHNGSTYLKTVSKIIFPFICVYGVYITLYGHISPGGAFSGGVVIAAGFILIMLSYGKKYSENILDYYRASLIESFSMLWYIVVGLFSVFTGYQFLSNKIAGIPTGIAGTVFSGGSIFLLNTTVAFKVFGTMYILFSLITPEEVEK
ncbi:Membrane bound protein complex subunit mbxF [Caldanaerovirga acetigignens]|uniref:Membrane bound protein complex subunit mbxF n=1 Tax=Caldanaerovirga acetigignens TaxID=447595 RepID=A0A1M7JJC8_9FIRM|nr:MnhB domain-containing protein [Caldanaerovirga acetigignens]SHM53114.1 Membrane bound protein complex subunit mbxF [Caldanaerovirga acetigignens]